MPELPAIPDPGWSSTEKAFYCRAQAINLLEEAERADNASQAEELAGVALRWLALARFHEAEATRSLVTDELTRKYANSNIPSRDSFHSRHRNLAED
jgi:hypothetical protein